MITGCGNLGDDPAGAPLPSTVGARAISQHYVEVAFASPAQALAGNVGSYGISDPSGTPLRINSAMLRADGNSVLLVTDAQRNVLYELAIGRAGSATADQTLSFTGSLLPEPIIEDAVALDNTSVLLVFSDAMNADTASNVANYALTNAETGAAIAVESAEIGEDPNVVVLITPPQDDVQYEVEVGHLESVQGADGSVLMLDPDLNSAFFFGIAVDDDVLPQVTGAKSTSSTSILVSFSEPVDIPAADPTRFVISPELTITDAVLTRYQTQVLLTTLPQTPDTEYTVTATNVTDLAGNAIDPDADSASFNGTSRELFLYSAVALTNTTVLVTFSEAVDARRGLNHSLYRIADPDGNPDIDIIILDAEADPIDPRAYILTTTAQQNVEYLLRANNMRALTDNQLIDPARHTSSFYGIAANDTDGPILMAAVSSSSSTVLLTFSEPLDEDAADPVNFGLRCEACATKDLLVFDAWMTAHNTQIVLATHPQTAGKEYRVTVTNTNGEFTDLSVHRNTLDPDPSTATFRFSGQPLLTPGTTVPRVVGAISTSNTTVVVVFSKPMGDSAIEPGNYVIVQLNVNSEVGTVAITRAEFVGPDRTAVLLTTSSQNEVTYEVTVVNARDLAGNQLAPPEILVNPASAVFPGTPANASSLVDSDGDGVSDNAELRGYMVFVELVTGDIVTTEVTSDPFVADTDGDGLGDAQERNRFSNPRSGDTDADLIGDYDEVYLWHSNATDQDSDDDGLGDSDETVRFKTSPILDDTDGDGLMDHAETIVGNRDPRISDLPEPGIQIGEVALRLDTRFAYTDTVGESTSMEQSTQATLTQSDQQTFARSDTETTKHVAETGTEAGYSTTGGGKFEASVGYAFTRENTFTASQESVTATQNEYQESLTAAVQRDVTQSITRTVEDASVEVVVTVTNFGDIPFTMSNFELTGLLQDTFDRSRFIPIATLRPAVEVDGIDEFEVFLGPFIAERGPFVFKSTEIFPSLVEDLLKNPRGLIFKVANFDIVDEAGRNFAFISQDVNDRTAGLIVDFGNGTVDRYRVATHNTFDPATEEPSGVTMAFALRDIIGLVKNGPVDAIDVGPNGCGETFASGDDVQVVTPICFPVVPGGTIIGPGPNGILETLPAGDDAKSLDGLSIIDGGDGCAHTRASRDDVQIVRGDCETAGLNGVIVLAGRNGVIDTIPDGDDALTTVTGYGTDMAGQCDGNTDTLNFIVEPMEDGNGVADSVVRPGSDDIQLVFIGDPVEPGEAIIDPGPDGQLASVAFGDDVLQAPGGACLTDADCPGEGACRMVEQLTRVKGIKNIPEERRNWVVLAPSGADLGADFDDLKLRSGETYSLAFLQDKDADGLFAREEFIFGSSDRNTNSDGCPLGDGAPGCDTNVFEFDTIRDFDEVKTGWRVSVEGQPTSVGFSSPIQPDTDSDRLFDDEERQLGTDPGKRDTDDDEISDSDEVDGYDIERRNGSLVNHVASYQSAIITVGRDQVLDTTIIGDDDEPVWTRSARRSSRPA